MKKKRKEVRILLVALIFIGLTACSEKNFDASTYVKDAKKDEDGNYTVKVKVKPSDIYQTLEQSATEVSKEKIDQGLKEDDPKVFASVLTESIQESIDRWIMIIYLK